MGQKILVVEDNELNLKLFCDLLRAHGYAAEPVRDGREAVERIRAFAPDLIVMDIQMPHISGLELIEQIKADDGLMHMPIMAVTAYAARGDEERIRDAGAEGYVSKPISVLRFVESVADLLEVAAARAVPAGMPAPDEMEAADGEEAEAAADEGSEGGEAETAAEDEAEAEADPETNEAAEPEGQAAPETPEGEEVGEEIPPDRHPDEN